jgi:nucleoside-diphosphate-sugar epimerase
MPVGILGATGFVGRAVQAHVDAAGRRSVAVSRQAAAGGAAAEQDAPIPMWIAVCPIWALPDHFARLEAAGATRLVALSSTSRFTKVGSADAGERDTARKLAAAEHTVVEWADRRGVAVTILRPTLIYDGIHDRNIATIAAFVRRWGFFPVVGAAGGLRQPVHVDDVAAACVAAATAAAPEPTYDLSGGETLPYRLMVERIFRSVGRAPRIISLPRWVARAGVAALRAFPAYRHLTMAMFDRMDEDLAFDHAAAHRDLGFSPRAFVLPSGGPAGHS